MINVIEYVNTLPSNLPVVIINSADETIFRGLSQDVEQSLLDYTPSVEEGVLSIAYKQSEVLPNEFYIQLFSEDDNEE